MGLNSKTLATLYKALIGSILDYSFPCINLISNTNLNKLQTIQNAAVRSILKLKHDTPTNVLHHEAFEKLKIHSVENRLSDLTENYVRRGLEGPVPLVVRLASEYSRGFTARDIKYSTPLCNCHLVLDNFLL